MGSRDEISGICAFYRRAAPGTMDALPKDEDALRTLVERPHTRRLWTVPREVSPKLVSATFGRGDRLIGLGPITQRPQYFVVRIDSSWRLEAEDDEPSIRDHIDDIKDAIEDQFGMHVLDDEEIEDGEDVRAEWPTPDFGIGCEWFPIDPLDLLEDAPLGTGAGEPTQPSPATPAVENEPECDS